MASSTQAQQAGPPVPLPIGFALAKSVSEGNGKIAGTWWSSIPAPCAPNMNPPAVTVTDTSLIARFTIAGTCNGQPEYFMMRRAQPIVVPDGACAFDYVTIGGMIPGVFQEVTEKTAPPGGLDAFRKALLNLHHVFATQQAGGVLALIGWSDQPIAATSSDAEKRVHADVERLRSAGLANYKIEVDAPWALIDVRDYEDGGKPRRDTGMNLIDGRGCLFSAKFSRARDPEDNVWSEINSEFERMRRVIGNYESGKPWVLSGAK
jgi:hypothetical protein